MGVAGCSVGAAVGADAGNAGDDAHATVAIHKAHAMITLRVRQARLRDFSLRLVIMVSPASTSVAPASCFVRLRPGAVAHLLFYVDYISI